MPMTPLAGLEGLTLHVSDVERSRDFYARIPSFELVRRRAGQLAVFRAGDGLLGLLSFGAPGFHVEIVTSDLDEVHALLRSRGLRPDGPPRMRGWGERTFLVRDPDGNVLEFQ